MCDAEGIRAPPDDCGGTEPRSSAHLHFQTQWAGGRRSTLKLHYPISGVGLVNTTRQRQHQDCNSLVDFRQPEKLLQHETRIDNASTRSCRRARKLQTYQGLAEEVHKLHPLQLTFGSYRLLSRRPRVCRQTGSWRRHRCVADCRYRSASLNSHLSNS